MIDVYPLPGGGYSSHIADAAEHWQREAEQLRGENERLEELLKNGKGARSIAMKTAAWLAFQSHDVDANILDMLERMRVKSIQVRKELDEAIDAERGNDD
jgi:hypothetical protein